ncbi:MAG: hypothetical protein ACKOZU_07160 [Planctomycetaceae bacterium]
MRHDRPGSIPSRWILCCCCALACLSVAAAQPRGEALKPSAARRVEENAAAVTAELRDIIASTSTAQGEQLQGLVADDPAAWGIRYRDGHLLFSIPVRKNLSLREKSDGEAEAAQLAIVTLGQKFDRLLELDDASLGLDRDAVRVILIEPDARRAYGRMTGIGGYGGSGGYGAHVGVGVGVQAGVVGACPCQPVPLPCGCQ